MRQHWNSKGMSQRQWLQMAPHLTPTWPKGIPLTKPISPETQLDDLWSLFESEHPLPRPMGLRICSKGSSWLDAQVGLIATWGINVTQPLAYLSYNLYDVPDFQLKLIVILGQVAECHLASASPSIAWMGKAKYLDTVLLSHPTLRF